MTSENTDIQWALDLLAPDPNYEENFLSKNYNWIAWPIIAIGGTAFLNTLQYRPLHAGLHRYGIALACGLVAAKVLKDAKYKREAQRDAVMRQYIKLHPELFPPPVRKTFNQVLRDWVPCR